VLPAQGTPAPVSSPLTSPTLSISNKNASGSALFLDARQATAPPTDAGVSRARWAKIDEAVLLDPQGKPLKLPPNAEITLNLFPDTTYAGVIEKVQQEGGGYTWVGHLKGVENSELFIVYTAGVFIGHFASPSGVYEVSSAGGDLYKIVQIDQSKLPGGEGNLYVPSDTF
jgi:hypothetical protein